MKSRIPLAWHNLTHDWRRLAVSVSGVGFAVLLIFMQLGFLNALLESTVQTYRRLKGELVMINPAKYTMPARDRFDIRRIHTAKGIPGVADVYPVYTETYDSVLRPRNSRGYPIRVIAFRAEDPVFEIDWVSGNLSDLRRPSAALIDVASKSKFHVPPRSELARYDGELAGKRIRFVGQFRLGIDFAFDGNVIMTAENFADYFPQRLPGRNPLDAVDVAVIKLDEKADVAAVQKALQTALPNDVEVLTKAALIAREKNFWKKTAPISYIFLVGVYVGFLVGVIICYQIIYADIADHMAEFATLKAMGYTNRYFTVLVLTEALYLSLMGFIPSLIVTYCSYSFLASFTGLTMQMTMPLAVTVLSVTMAMCAVSGLLAVRKLLSLDPAELF